MIGPARYGVLTIAWILLGYFGLFDLGLGRATSFRIAALANGTPDQRANTFWAAVVVNVAMGLVGGGVLWLAAGFFFADAFKVPAALRPEIMSAVPLLALSLPIATLTGVLTGAMQGRQKFLAINVISVLSAVLFQLFPLWVAWKLGPNVVNILFAALGARCVALVALAGLCGAEFLRRQRIRIVWTEIPLLLSYGGWVTVASLLAPLLVMVDRFAIGATLGAVPVAVYSIPYQPAKQLQILPSALTNALFPKLSSASKAEQAKFERNTTLILASLISLPVLGGIFLADPALRLWVGASLGGQAAPVGKLLLLGFWVNAFAMISYTSLQATGRPDLVTKMQIAEVPPYFLALYIGLTFFGLPGAAAAFLFRCLIDYGVLTAANGKRFPGLGVLAINLTLLALGAYLSSLWVITDWRWWASAIGVGLPMLALAWSTLPGAIKTQILDRMSRRLGPVQAT
jgi:O-antigen/teichoic acid export membrane protein